MASAIKFLKLYEGALTKEPYLLFGPFLAGSSFIYKPFPGGAPCLVLSVSNCGLDTAFVSYDDSLAAGTLLMVGSPPFPLTSSFPFLTATSALMSLVLAPFRDFSPIALPGGLSS